MKAFKPSIRVGILGGGQLARMLALRGHQLGCEVHVLSAKADDPAAQVTSHWHKGDTHSKADLKKFLLSVDLATFESEFLDADLLTKISRECKVPIFPEPKQMGLLQDRQSQKELLDRLKINTSPWMSVSSFNDASEAYKKFDGSFILKKRRFGYDGYGTYPVRSAKDLRTLQPIIAENSFGFIAEKFVSFQRELATMIVRRQSGQMLRLPFVETFQEDSRCLWVKGPISDARLTKFAKKIETILSELKYIGIMGIEIFDTKRELLVNELAPRVHNSGHYSLDALHEDQFTLHLKALLDFKFSKPRLSGKGFAMYNLLGSSTAPPKWHLPPSTHLHWYGKTENRKGRKMGHYNVLDVSAEAALKRAARMRKEFQV